MAKDWCNEKDPTNKKVLDFLRKYQIDAQQVALKLDIPVTWLLGLSATECAFGTSNIARNANNFFGQTAGASGSIGYFTTSKGVKVAKFKDFKSSVQSFATDFGKLVRSKRTIQDFINSLVPRFNTTDPKTNGNPNFKNDTLVRIDAGPHRVN
jgi:uncharacterized FlgJ-related protein